MATVVLENVNAHFPLYGSLQRSLRKTIFGRATGGSIAREGRHGDRVTVKALTDISLTLKDGDRVGLIGHNGAGKSTLLRVMAGIYQPVSGTIRVEGRVTPLFDAMPGLDGEDSGYENIITSGMLIGMTRQEIEAKIPKIEEFCELGEYLALPVRTYSTGMQMRLGFALVTALDPGVLLIDEGFGTGDLRFAERAQARMKEFVGRSSIMVLASHSDATIRSMCNKAIMMEGGSIVASGSVAEICDRYYESVHVETVAVQTRRLGSIGPSVVQAQIDSEGSVANAGLADRLMRSNGAVRLTKITARDASGDARWNFSPGETAIFRVEFKVLERVSSLALLFRLNTQLPDGAMSDVIFADMQHVISSEPIEAGYEGVVELSLKVQCFMPNDYFPYVWLGRKNGVGAYDIVDANVGLPPLTVRSSADNESRGGLVALPFEISKPCVLATKDTASVAP